MWRMAAGTTSSPTRYRSAFSSRPMRAGRLRVRHAQEAEIKSYRGAQLGGPGHGQDGDMRNAVVISTGQFDWDQPDTWTGVLDRSACGTGTCAKMATLHARGRLKLGQPFRHEGILGTVFTGCLVEETRVGPYAPVIPTITRSPWITGIRQYL